MEKLPARLANDFQEALGKIVVKGLDLWPNDHFHFKNGALSQYCYKRMEMRRPSSNFCRGGISKCSVCNYGPRFDVQIQQV